MNKEIQAYNTSQSPDEKKICSLLAKEIDVCLPEAESKIWHGGPVWFLEGNPVVGYSMRKAGVQLMFWSGMSFEEKDLKPIGNVEKYKAAGVCFANVDQVDVQSVRRWVKKSRDIQWDYKNIVKKKGVLERLK